jgi:hypothetical protein
MVRIAYLTLQGIFSIMKMLIHRINTNPGTDMIINTYKLRHRKMELPDE